MATSLTERFFDGVRRREREPLLAHVVGSVRFDVHQGRQVDRWLVHIDHGDTSVVPGEDSAADTVLHADAALFERLVTGEANAMASMLRGLVGFEGDPRLAVLAQRLFAAGRPA